MLYNTAVQSDVMLLDANMEALHLGGDTCQLKAASALDTLTSHSAISCQILIRQIAVLSLQLPRSKVFQGEAHCTNVLAQAYVRDILHPHPQLISTTPTLKNGRKRRCHQLNMTKHVNASAIIMTVNMSWGTVTAHASSRLSAPVSSISLRHNA